MAVNKSIAVTGPSWGPRKPLISNAPMSGGRAHVSVAGRDDLARLKTKLRHPQNLAVLR